MPPHVTNVKGIGETESVVIWSSVSAKITKKIRGKFRKEGA